MKTYKRILSSLIWITAALVIWETVSYIMTEVLKDPMAGKKVPGIMTIVASFSEHGASLLHQAGITFSYAAAGFALGASIGIILAIIMTLSGIVEKMVLPYLLMSQMIPILGLAPIIFGLFKTIEASRVIIAAYITFFPVSINLLSGLKSVGSNLTELLDSYGARRYQMYKKLLLPYALPYLFTGLKISAPMAVTASILVDTLSSRDGIGYVIIFTLYGGGTVGQFWPAVITAALMGVLSFFIISAAEYVLVPWRRGKGGV